MGLAQRVPDGVQRDVAEREPAGADGDREADERAEYPSAGQRAPAQSRKRYLTSAKSAGNPSRQVIFLPSA